MKITACLNQVFADKEGVEQIFQAAMLFKILLLDGVDEQGRRQLFLSTGVLITEARS